MDSRAATTPFAGRFGDSRRRSGHPAPGDTPQSRRIIRQDLSLRWDALVSLPRLTIGIREAEREVGVPGDGPQGSPPLFTRCGRKWMGTAFTCQYEVKRESFIAGGALKDYGFAL